jgi:hypothetical protein
MEIKGTVVQVFFNQFTNRKKYATADLSSMREKKQGD